VPAAVRSLNKLPLDGGFQPVSNGWMSTRTPTALKEKRAEMAYERAQLAKRMAELDAEVDALDYALRVIDPEWVPPRRISKPGRQTLLPRGAVAQSCLQYLRQHAALWTPELAKLIATRFKLVFEGKQAEQDFASSVAMALRRYERQGLLEVVETDPRTTALKWRLRTGPDGRLALVRNVA
jgi:hypothetical protein